ncbi:TPA: hypothetical protein NKQ36_002441 [Vibrio parahaemolyticus]|nr:hypothetical protein [Vibrio parahaemolyticus]
MIEVITNGSGIEHHSTWVLNVNGRMYILDDCTKHDDERVFVSSNNTGGESIKISDVEDTPSSEFPSNIYLGLDCTDIDFHEMVRVIYLFSDENYIYFDYTWGEFFSSWDQPFNLIRLRRSIQNHLSLIRPELVDNELSDASYDAADLYIGYKLPKKDFVYLKDIFDLIKRDLDRASMQAHKEMIVNGWSDKVVSAFRFPEAYQTYCVKYLQYFVEFLNDMGIEAKSSLSIDGRDTLFCIEPLDKDTSLKQIHDALGLYLGLASRGDIIASRDSFDVMTQVKIEKLNFEITSLKSALRLKDAMLLAYESNTSVAANHDNVIEGSLEFVVTNNERETSAEFFDGIVKLGVYKIGPLELDVGKLANFILKR